MTNERGCLSIENMTSFSSSLMRSSSIVPPNHVILYFHSLLVIVVKLRSRLSDLTVLTTLFRLSLL